MKGSELEPVQSVSTLWVRVEISDLRTKLGLRTDKFLITLDGELEPEKTFLLEDEDTSLHNVSLDYWPGVETLQQEALKKF